MPGLSYSYFDAILLLVSTNIARAMTCIVPNAKDIGRRLGQTYIVPTSNLHIVDDMMTGQSKRRRGAKS